MFLCICAQSGGILILITLSALALAWLHNSENKNKVKKRLIITKFPSSTLEVDTLMKTSDGFLSREFNKTSDRFFYFKMNHNQVLEGIRFTMLILFFAGDRNFYIFS